MLALGTTILATMRLRAGAAHARPKNGGQFVAHRAELGVDRAVAGDRQLYFVRAGVAEVGGVAACAGDVDVAGEAALVDKLCKRVVAVVAGHEVDGRAAADEGVGQRRAAVGRQRCLQDIGQRDVAVVAGEVQVVDAGREPFEGVGVGLTAMAHDIVRVGQQNVVVVDFAANLTGGIAGDDVAAEEHCAVHMGDSAAIHVGLVAGHRAVV